MANTLQIKRSTTAGNVPTLAAGELGVNLTDDKLWVGDGSTNLQLNTSKPDSYTKLLIHSDTTDGRGTFTDSSPSGHAVTATNAVHKTAQNKFGASSIYFDGSGDYLTLPDHADWDFGSGDFTLEAWVNLANISTYHMIMCQDNNSGQLAWHLRTQTTGALLFRYSSDGTEDQTDLVSTASVITVNTWHHVAFVRSSNTYAFYVDGVQKGTGSITATLHNSSTTPLIGIRGGNSLPFEGYMDEVRVSKGIARWTAAFTPPTRAYATFSAGGGVFTGELLTPRLGVGAFNTGNVDYALNVEGAGRFTDGLIVVGGLTATGNLNLSGGGTASFSGEIAANGGIGLADNGKATFGTGDDLQIYHDASNSRITNTTGSLWLQSDTGIRLTNLAVTKSKAAFYDLQVELYYDGAKKLETTATGVSVTGALLPSVNGTHNLGASNAYWKNAYLEDTAINGTLYVGGVLTAAGGISLGDNDKAIFGDSSDLKIYHDGSNSHIKNTGSLYVASETSGNLHLRSDGHVLLDSGKVGIGTDSPGRPLEVNGTGNASVIRVGDGDTDGAAAIAYIEFGANGSSWNRHSYMGSAGADSHLWIVNEENADIKFYANNAEKMVIKNDGKVGVGTSSPGYKLEVAGAKSGDWLARIHNTASSNAPNGLAIKTDYTTVNQGSTGGGYLLGCEAGSEGYRFVVKNDGSVGIGTVLPTYNLHIKPASGNARLKLESDSGSADVEMMLDSASSTRNAHITFYNAGTQKGGIGYVASGTIMKMWGDNNPADNHLCINSAGRVGLSKTPNAAVTLSLNAPASDATKYGLEVCNASANTRFLVDGLGTTSFYGSDNTLSARVTSDGKVGIGTDSPAVKLDLYEPSSGSAWIKLGNSSRPAGMYIGMDAGELQQIYVGGNHPFTFWTNDTEKVRIAGDGKFGIGCTPAAPLDTVGRGSFRYSATTSSSKRIDIEPGNTSNTIQYVTNPLNIWNSSSMTMSMLNDGKVGINCTPTHKLQVLTTDAKGFYLERNTGSNAANLNEFSTHYSLSIKNREGGSFLNFGGNSVHSSMQATDGAGTASAKHISLNPHGGSVGIGTPTPAAQLQVIGPNAVGTFFAAQNDGASGVEFKRFSAGTYPYNHFLFNNGYIGIGAPTPLAPLHINSTSWPQIKVEYNSSTYFTLDHAATLNVYNNDWLVRLNNSTKLTIKQDGNVGIGTTTVNRTSNTVALTIGNGTADNYRSALELVGSEVTSDDAVGSIAFWNVGGAGGQIATIAGYRSGANNSGSLLFQTKNAGTNATRLTIAPDGLQDHKANHIVNSETVQGLQDSGACYDFDGAVTGDDAIDLNADPIGAGEVTIAAWVKVNGQGENGYGRIIDNGKCELYYHGGSKRFSFVRDDATQAHTGDDSWPVANFGKWVHVVATSTSDGSSSEANLYINGVLTGAADQSAGPPAVGATDVFVGNNAAKSRTFHGQIRDVKIFPSVLTGADIRKLYSGENPKKNLGIELIPNGTFGGNGTTGWAKQSGSSTASVVNGKFRITSTANNVTYWEEGITTLTVGKYYKFSFTLIDGTQANEYVYAGTASVGTQYVDKANITAGKYTYIFKATSATLFVTLGHNCTSGSNQYSEWDDISVQEVGTLVDYTSRSGHSQTWYNEAIPNLYDGNVQGEAVLSPQSTDHKVNGKFDVHHGSISIQQDNYDSTFNINSRGPLPGFLTGSPFFKAKSVDTTGDTILAHTWFNHDSSGVFSIRHEGATTPTARLSITANGNVGINTVAPDYKLHVAGDYIFVDSDKGIRFGGSSHQISRESSGELRLKSANTSGFITLQTGDGTTALTLASTQAATFSGNATFNGAVNINAQTAININADCAGNVGYAAQYFNLDNSTSDATGHIRLARTAGTAFLGMEIAADAKHGIRFLTTDGGTLTERLKIDQNGKVGIGCVPAKTLELSNSTSNVAALRVTRSTSLTDTYTELGTVGGSGRLEAFKGNIRIGADPDNNTSDSTIEFLTDNSVKMVVKSDGKVGINTAAPDQKLHVVASAAGRAAKFVGVDSWYAVKTQGSTNTSQSYGQMILAGTSSSDKALRIYNAAGSADLFMVRGDGNVGIGTSSPGSYKLYVNGSSYVNGTLTTSLDLVATQDVEVGGDIDLPNGSIADKNNATGTSGQALLSDGSGKVEWGAVGSASISKVTFNLQWKTSGTSFSGSSRGDGASSKLSFETGLDWGDNKITLHHDLDTEYLVASILDVDGGHTGAGEYLDMNFDSDVVTKKIDNNKTQLIFDANNNIAAGQNFRVTFVG